MLSNTGKYRDRNSDITPAGKLFSVGHTAKECMKNPERLKTPDHVKKFRCTTQPAAGRQRIFYGRYNDPNTASQLTHGINTKPSYVAGQLINPTPKSCFQHRLNEKREEAVYASRQRAPLGESHDQKKGLPKGLELYTTRFGIQVVKDVSAGELVNPCKSNKEIAEESSKGEELYKISHTAYDVGEAFDRNYDWSRVPETSSFGIETPHDNRGLNTRNTLKWLNETIREKETRVTSKRVDDFRERQIPQVGTVHDPIKDTLNVDKNHVFGIVVKPDEHGASELIHMRNPNSFLRGRERERGVLAAIRQHLKNANYQNFDNLKAAFIFYDKDRSGTIDIHELREVCQHFHLPIQDELMEMLLECVDIDNNKSIDYIEFINFLNWKDKMPTGFQRVHENSSERNINNKNQEDYNRKILLEAKLSGPSSNEKEGMQTDLLEKQVNSSSGKEITSSSSEKEITSSVYKNSLLNELIKGSRKYGIPTIRSDIPAPRIRRIGDNTNYGDESDSYGLINPSIYSNHGVYESDFFKRRHQNEIRRICDSIGVEINNEIFQDVWNKARESMCNGEVSVESFRNVLDEQIAEEYQKMSLLEGDHSNHLGNLVEKMTTMKPAVYQTLTPKKSKEITTA